MRVRVFLPAALLLDATFTAAFAQQPGPKRAAQPVETKLECTFAAGATAQYRIQLTVRSELQGEQPETIGAKTYVRPFSRTAERRVEWRATRHILSVSAEGAADLEELLDDFGAASAPSSSPADADAKKLDQSLESVIGKWIAPGSRTLRYRETSTGQLSGLSPDAVPALDEASPPLLALWLLRALRPATALPARPVQFDVRWQEPRTAKLDGWTNVQGYESGEWLVAPGVTEPAAQLLISQQITGAVMSGPEKPPEGHAEGRFQGESLATLSLNDGSLLAATRSASREITWTLAPVAGLDHPPQFRARLSAQVEIEECHGSCGLRNNRRATLRQRP